MAKPTGAALAQAGYPLMGTPYKQMDCQAFVEACLRRVGISLNLAGSNAWYRRMTWVGTPEDCKRVFGEIPVGAFLYCWRQDGAPAHYTDGRGNASHIGIYTATGQGAINSSSTRGQVCESKFAGKSISGGWNRVGLWREIDYGPAVSAKLGEPSETTPAASPAPSTGTATVTGGRLNVREKPGGAKITQLPEGTEVDVLETDGEWSRIEYAATGWVKDEYLARG